MAIQDSPFIYATDLLREAEWADKVCDQGTWDTAFQQISTSSSRSLPALSAVGRHMTIRSLVCRIEDHRGARLPTNHICMSSQMTSLLSTCSLVTLSLSAYIENLCLHASARQALVSRQNPDPDICGPQGDTLRPPGIIASIFLPYHSLDV